MSLFKNGLIKLLIIVSVLFTLLLIMPFAYLVFHMAYSKHERANAAALRCLHDSSSQSMSTILGEVHIRIPLSYLKSCNSGAPVTGNPLDDPVPGMILIARLPDFTPLTEEEKKQEIHTTNKIQIEITGRPVSLQEKWKREEFLFPTEKSILTQAVRTNEYPQISHQFGMKEYILSKGRISYILEDKDSQTRSALQCFQKENTCSAISPYLLSGLSVNYKYDYSQRVNATAIQKHLKQFIESLKIGTGR